MPAVAMSHLISILKPWQLCIWFEDVHYIMFHMYLMRSVITIVARDWCIKLLYYFWCIEFLSWFPLITLLYSLWRERWSMGKKDNQRPSKEKFFPLCYRVFYLDNVFIYVLYVCVYCLSENSRLFHCIFSKFKKNILAFSCKVTTTCTYI